VTAETSLADLLVRTIVALGIVLALIAVAYVVVKRRGAPTLRAGRRGSRRTAPAGVEVVGRVGLSRSSAAVAVRFGDRIVLLATSESGTTTSLSEMSAAEWDEMHTVREPLQDVLGRPVDSPAQPRVTFVEALRQATARHA
jgi:flagellar biogenesis protein FliO